VGVDGGPKGLGIWVNYRLQFEPFKLSPTQSEGLSKKKHTARVKVAESVTATHCRWTFAVSAGNPLKCSGNLISISI